MKNPKFPKMLSLVLAASCFTLGCVVYPNGSAEVEVNGDPPAPIAEQIVPAPGIGYAWIGGAWAWHGGWVWESGHWERPPHPGAVWVANRYAIHNGRHVFVRGGWR